MERLLYRLSQSPHRDRFVVKGAMMFSVWTGLTHRPTRDLDLLGNGEANIDDFQEIFRSICSITFKNDGLVFDSSSVTATRMKEGEKYEGIRVRFNSYLGSARIPIQVDVGFGDAITPKAELITFPSVLQFPAPTVLSYTRETTIAEKFQAMTNLGMANSRMKDFFDLFTLITQFEFEGVIVSQAI